MTYDRFLWPLPIGMECHNLDLQESGMQLEECPETERSVGRKRTRVDDRADSIRGRHDGDMGDARREGRGERDPARKATESLWPRLTTPLMTFRSQGEDTDNRIPGWFYWHYTVRLG